MEVASACNSPGNVGGQQTAKRKFFQWAVKWFYANMAEDSLEKPDAPVLICLLQSIGFQLREFEKIEDSNGRNKDTKPSKDTVRLFVECGTSGMRACLELKDVKCKCPNSEDAEDASFWSVSGTGPKAATKIANVNRIEESGSNLLPPVSKDTSKILHDVTYHLLNIIVDKSSDINQNSSNLSNLNLSTILNASNNKDETSVQTQSEKLKNLSTSIMRSYTQPEIHLAKNARKSNWTIRQLDKMSGAAKDHGDVTKWSTDLENDIIDNDQPRPSPPKISSSPVFMTQLSNSLGQISLQSEEETSNVTEHVLKARKNLDKALELLMAKKSPNYRNSPYHDQATFLKPAPGSLNLTGGALRRLSTSSSNTSLRSSSGTARSRPSSACSLPARDMSMSQGARTSTSHAVTGTPKSSNSAYSRRTIGGMNLAVSATNVVQSNSAASATIKRQISNVEQNSGTTTTATSKIPGRRKSFGVLSSQPLRLAATAAKNTAIATKKKSPDPKSSTTMNQQSLSHKNVSSINQPAPTNLKFGYVKKKSSHV